MLRALVDWLVVMGGNISAWGSREVALLEQRQHKQMQPISLAWEQIWPTRVLWEREESLVLWLARLALETR